MAVTYDCFDVGGLCGDWDVAVGFEEGARLRILQHQMLCA